MDNAKNIIMACKKIPAEQKYYGCQQQKKREIHNTNELTEKLTKMHKTCQRRIIILAYCEIQNMPCY